MTTKGLRPNVSRRTPRLRHENTLPYAYAFENIVQIPGWHMIFYEIETRTWHLIFLKIQNKNNLKPKNNVNMHIQKKNASQPRRSSLFHSTMQFNRVVSRQVIRYPIPSLEIRIASQITLYLFSPTQLTPSKAKRKFRFEVITGL